MDTLYDLFEECLSISYITVGESASYALRRAGDELFIFFEGSNGRKDWRNNLDFPARAVPDGAGGFYAHRGFLRAWKALVPHLAPAIGEKSIRRITLVGYSHGGALAVLCHEHVWRMRPDMRERLRGFGFGAPRVLWGKREPSLTKRWEHFTVVRNQNDLVTHLPPAFLGYYHAGHLLCIGEKGKYTPSEAHFPEHILAELKKARMRPPT